MKKKYFAVLLIVFLSVCAVTYIYNNGIKLVYAKEAAIDLVTEGNINQGLNSIESSENYLEAASIDSGNFLENERDSKEEIDIGTNTEEFNVSQEATNDLSIIDSEETIDSWMPEENLSSLEVKGSTVYTGDEWAPQDNFVQATNQDGENVAFDMISVESSEVNMNKAGVYSVYYSYGNLTRVAEITVIEKDKYEVTIPANINLNDTSTVSISGTNYGDKTLAVMSTENTLTLVNELRPRRNMKAPLTWNTAENKLIIPSDGGVGTNGEAMITIEIPKNDMNNSIWAGKHTGTLNFVITYE